MTAPSRRPRVSVVVPCFNAAPYLAEALSSVAAQQVADVEVLVVDDGSTDGSGDVARAHPVGAVVHRQDNAGISAARNLGVARARGALVTFLDADDVWTPGSLRARLAALDADPAAGAAAGLVEQFVSPDLPPDVRAHLAVPAAPSRGRVAGALLLRRETVDRIGPFDAGYRLGETIDWVARADAAGVRFADVPAIVLRRRVHGANSVRKAEQLRADYLRVLRASIDRRRQQATVGEA